MGESALQPALGARRRAYGSVWSRRACLRQETTDEQECNNDGMESGIARARATTGRQQQSDVTRRVTRTGDNARGWWR